MCISYIYIDLNDVQSNFARFVWRGRPSWVGQRASTESAAGVGTFEGNGRYVVLIMIVYPASMKLMITGKSLQCL